MKILKRDKVNLMLWMIMVSDGDSWNDHAKKTKAHEHTHTFQNAIKNFLSNEIATDKQTWRMFTVTKAVN